MNICICSCSCLPRWAIKILISIDLAHLTDPICLCPTFSVLLPLDLPKSSISDWPICQSQSVRIVFAIFRRSIESHYHFAKVYIHYLLAFLVLVLIRISTTHFFCWCLSAIFSQQKLIKWAFFLFSSPVLLCHWPAIDQLFFFSFFYLSHLCLIWAGNFRPSFSFSLSNLVSLFSGHQRQCQLRTSLEVKWKSWLESQVSRTSWSDRNQLLMAITECSIERVSTVSLCPSLHDSLWWAIPSWPV